jgi:HK97 family phage major capsid protein
MTTTKALPKNPKEWEEYIDSFKDDDPQRGAARFAEELSTGNFRASLDSYMHAQNGTMADLKAELTEQMQASVLELAKRNGIGSGAIRHAATQGGAPRADAPGAALNGKTNSAAEFFQTVLRKPELLSPEARALRGEILNYTSTTGEGGGFLIPEEWRSEIFSAPALEEAVVRPRATVIPMSSLTLKYPAIDFTTEVGETLGGMSFYWMDEDGEIPDTSANFAQVEFHAWRMGGAAIVPNDTLKDGPALETWIRTNLPRGISDFEDRAFIKGDGVKKPLGALTTANPSLITVTKESGQPAASITWNNVLAMFARMLPDCYDAATWTITPDALPEIFTMALPVGTGGSAVMIAPGAGNVAPTMTLLGRPIKWSRKAPGVLGTQGDISLADYRMYGIGDRQSVQLDTSEHVRFLSDKTVFRVIERVDGQPLLKSAFTPENGGPTLSAFVQIETRA